jgi:hypothetical protein
MKKKLEIKFLKNRLLSLQMTIKTTVEQKHQIVIKNPTLERNSFYRNKNYLQKSSSEE